MAGNRPPESKQIKKKECLATKKGEERKEKEGGNITRCIRDKRKKQRKVGGREEKNK